MAAGEPDLGVANVTQTESLPRGFFAAMRAVALGLIFAALLHDFLYLIEQRIQWPPDFGSYYVPARAIMLFPAINPYDYNAVSHLNALQHFVTGTFFPYVYPPAALLLLRPIAQLPATMASNLWALASHACAIGSAFLLADTFAHVVHRKRQETSGHCPRGLENLHTILQGTSITLGKWRIATLPTAVSLAAMLFAFPVEDTYYFGQVNLLVLFCLVLALHAHVHDRPVLAGFAVAVAGGLKLTPLFALAFFLARGSWKAVAAGLAFSVLFAAVPLVTMSPGIYGDFFTALRTFDATFVSIPHNESFVGMLSHAVGLVTHGDVHAISLAQRAAQVIGVALAAIGVGGLAVASYRRSELRWGRSSFRTRSLDLDWLGFALVITAYLLTTPLVWSHYYVVALPAVLMLVTYPLLRDRQTDRDWMSLDTLTVLCGTVTLAIIGAKLPLNADHGDSQAPAKLAFALRSLRALALFGVWGALAAHVARVLWRTGNVGIPRQRQGVDTVAGTASDIRSGEDVVPRGHAAG